MSPAKLASGLDRCTEPLAILGSQPAFHEQLHVGRPNTGDRQALLARINEMLDRRWFSNDGPFVKEFEREIQRFVNVKHCIAMCNATAALGIAIRALDLKGEVIVPSYTFVATAHALQWQGVVPIFADIDPETHNIDPAEIEKLITPRTSGIIGVHLWGRHCDTVSIDAIARRRNLRVMYDAAHAFGCSHAGRMIGGFGACEVFSFHATKFLNSFEGGAVVTNDDVLAEKMRLMRNFGFAGYDRVIYLGVNGKMTEVCAAMGLTCLDAVHEIIAVNRRNYEAYKSALRDLPGITLLQYTGHELRNYQYIVLDLDAEKYGLTRDELIQVLRADNVLARKYFWPGCHRMEPYRSRCLDSDLLLPVTEEVAERVLVLPTGQDVSISTVRKICNIVRSASYRAPEIRRTVHGAPFELSGRSKAAVHG